jgi:hypothetical protein
MRFILLVILFTTNYCCLSAQTDTTKGFLSKYNYKSAQEDAVYYFKLYRDGNLWHRKAYFISNNILKYDSYFADELCKKIDGKSSEYSDNGILFFEENYSNSKIMNGSYYFENGKKAGYAEYDTAAQKIIKQQGWDESGKEIIGYQFYRDAEFPGKMAGWIKFLQKNLNSDTPNKYKAPIGKYSVILGFFVEADGTLTDIKVLEDPGFGTGWEALRVLRLSKNWQPGIKNNKVERMLYRQPITFMVSD